MKNLILTVLATFIHCTFSTAAERYGSDSFPAPAAEKVYTLQEIFSIADKNETNIQISKSTAEMAAERLKESKLDKLPDITASLSASYIGDGWIAERDFSGGQTAPMPHFGNNFAFEASQVIYAGGILRTSEEMAKINSRMADNNVELTRQQTRLILTGYYLDLFRMRNQTVVYQNNADLMQRLVELGKSREREGTALRNDVTRYEMQLAEILLSLDKVRTETSILNFRLCTMLDIGSDTLIIPDTTLLRKDLDIAPERFWQEQGAEAPSVSVAASAAEIAEKNLKLAKAERIPKLAITVTDHLDGPILIEVLAMNNNFNYWYAGIGLKIDLGALYKSPSRIRQAKTGIIRSRQQLELVRQETAMNIRAAYERYLHSFTELETQTKNVELAGENYRIILNRYENGLSLVTDMIDAANMKLSAELAEVNARISMIYAWHQLLYASGTL